LPIGVLTSDVATVVRELKEHRKERVSGTAGLPITGARPAKATQRKVQNNTKSLK